MNTNLWTKVNVELNPDLEWRNGTDSLCVTSVSPGTQTLDISGTELRKRLRLGQVSCVDIPGILLSDKRVSQPIPDWFSYESVIVFFFCYSLLTHAFPGP